VAKKSSDMELDELVTPLEVEERWKLPRATQASLRSRGELPFILVAPRTPRYRKSSIEAWLADRERPTRVRRELDGSSAEVTRE
jgi:hypothetical protein